MEGLRLHQKVYIHEHNVKNADRYSGQCIGRIGTIIQLGDLDRDLIVKCDTCGSQNVIYQANRDPDYPPPRP